MTITLDQGTRPDGLETKTVFLFADSLRLGDYAISLDDCLALFQFVLQQTFLSEAKLTWHFWKYFQNVKIGEGYPYICSGRKIRTRRFHTSFVCLKQLVAVVEKVTRIVETDDQVIVLGNKTHPEHLQVKLGYIGIWIGDYYISDADFLFLLDYVLTNENFTENDSRKVFVRKVKRWKCFQKYAR